MIPIVIDTNIFVAALQKGDGVSRKILELAFVGHVEPVMGDALYMEYQSLMGRDHLFENSTFSARERSDFFDDFCSICRWVAIHYRWRPNLRDEGDNHVIELALAAGASTILTWNIKDFSHGDLAIPSLEVVTPVEYLKKMRKNA